MASVRRPKGGGAEPTRPPLNLLVDSYSTVYYSAIWFSRCLLCSESTGNRVVGCIPSSLSCVRYIEDRCRRNSSRSACIQDIQFSQ